MGEGNYQMDKITFNVVFIRCYNLYLFTIKVQCMFLRDIFRIFK